MKTFAIPTFLLWFENKNGNDSGFYFYPYPGHAKADKPRKNGAKIKRIIRDGTWIQKNNKSHFGYKLHGIIEIDYVLIRRFKKIIA